MAGEKRKEEFSSTVFSEDPLYKLVKGVGTEEMSLQQACVALRSYVASLKDEERETWKKDAVARSRRLMSIAEAFTQELAVLAAGQ